jgi:hypothetical protein
MSDEDIRLPLLQRLAEQAMSDPGFREIARGSLERALEQYGYDLNQKELALVLRFRQTLEEAGVDLFLTKELDLASLDPDVVASLMADARRN